MTEGAPRGRHALGWAVLALAACGGPPSNPGEAADGAAAGDSAQGAGPGDAATSDGSAGDAATSDGSAGDAPAGEASVGTGTCSSLPGTCNTLVDVAAPVTPGCMAGIVPTGTGGVIEDGTYVLTAETYYGTSFCPSEKLSETVVIAGGCYQVIAHTFDMDGGESTEFRATSAGTVQGNHLVLTPACTSLAGGTADAPTETFTASATTLTLFTANAAAGNGNPDRAAVFVKK